jgi:tRNA (guanine37-N1)-methyltransferase
MKISVLTLFPNMFEGFVQSSMVARAINKDALGLNFVDIRDFTHNKHRSVDDYPYGGFAGMVMKPEPIYSALLSCLKKSFAPVIYFSPQGRKLDQSILNTYSEQENVILLCGHYKEVDQRIRNLCISDEISIGDYVLSGGELAAMVFIDGVSRLQPNVLSDIESAESDSFYDKNLGFPCWTRPEDFMGLKVPEVLRQGNHKLMNKFVKKSSLKLTRTRRPDLD